MNPQGYKSDTDTIAQIITAPGKAAVGIIRVSGKEAAPVLKRVFKSKAFEEKAESHRVYYGHIYDEGGRALDEVLVTLMLAPKSYTREDVAEISCHGGVRTLQAVMTLLVRLGIRPAEPGEFTKRAFLNGRIDLSQAEAVGDIINAATELARRSAYSQLSGSLRDTITGMRNKILTLLAHIEASIDYPEHDLEAMNLQEVGHTTEELLKETEALIKTADYGKLVHEGIETAIAGRPNVGKSSLLNAILKEDRAIVTEIPGTTRDILQEYVNIHDIVLKITDTAGIRDTEDVVEKLGVTRARDYIRKADLVILVLDGSSFLTSEDIGILKMIQSGKAIVVVNKSDLPMKIEMCKLKSMIGKNPLVVVSALHKNGIEEIYKEIRNLFLQGDIVVNTEFSLYKSRHLHSLYQASASLKQVLEDLAAGQPEDLLSISLTAAYRSLGEITGDFLDDDIIDKIFSEFCLGK